MSEGMKRSRSLSYLHIMDFVGKVFSSWVDGLDITEQASIAH